MICLVGEIAVRNGVEAEFEAVVARLTKEVLANEPDVRVYQFARVRDREGAYRVMEAYASEAALEAHMRAPHLRAAMEKMGPLLAARPQIEKCDAIVG